MKEENGNRVPEIVPLSNKNKSRPDILDHMLFTCFITLAKGQP